MHQGFRSIERVSHLFKQTENVWVSSLGIEEELFESKVLALDLNDPFKTYVIYGRHSIRVNENETTKQTIPASFDERPDFFFFFEVKLPGSPELICCIFSCDMNPIIIFHIKHSERFCTLSMCEGYPCDAI